MNSPLAKPDFSKKFHNPLLRLRQKAERTLTVSTCALRFHYYSDYDSIPNLIWVVYKQHILFFRTIPLSEFSISISLARIFLRFSFMGVLGATCGHVNIQKKNQT